MYGSSSITLSNKRPGSQAFLPELQPHPDPGRDGSQKTVRGERGGTVMSEPKGRVGVWTEERGACDERRGKTPTEGAPEASGEAQ